MPTFTLVNATIWREIFTIGTRNLAGWTRAAYCRSFCLHCCLKSLFSPVCDIVTVCLYFTRLLQFCFTNLVTYLNKLELIFDLREYLILEFIKMALQQYSSTVHAIDNSSVVDRIRIAGIWTLAIRFILRRLFISSTQGDPKYGHPVLKRVMTDDVCVNLNGERMLLTGVELLTEGTTNICIKVVWISMVLDNL